MLWFISSIGKQEKRKKRTSNDSDSDSSDDSELDKEKVKRSEIQHQVTPELTNPADHFISLMSIESIESDENKDDGQE